jgi:16S rRNA (guanine527-N7)-methyltransferase
MSNKPAHEKEPGSQSEILCLIKTRFMESRLGALSDVAIQSFLSYLQILLRWNARINLTSERTPVGIVERHFVECAYAAMQIPPGISTLLDFGSGAGFPGIPIAICRPEIRVTLAESQHRKAAFLREAVRSLPLKCEVIDRRVESLPPTLTYDAVTARAVDKMEESIPIAASRANKFLVLLTSRTKSEHLENLAPDYSWAEPIPLPPRQQSVLLVGWRQSSSVPRGTKK